MSLADADRRAPPSVGAVVDARKTEALSAATSLDFSYAVLESPRRVQDGERRLFGRQRMRLRSGKLIRRDGQFICECLVHNRSASGGRLRLNAPAELPAAVYFYDDQSELLFEAQVMWRKEREIGVRLSSCAATPAQRAIAGRMRRKFYALKR